MIGDECRYSILFNFLVPAARNIVPSVQMTADCINKMFIPRKDWLTYLTYEMPNKPQKHDFYIDTLYTSQINKDSFLQKYKITQEIKNWIEQYCKEKNWL